MHTGKTEEVQSSASGCRFRTGWWGGGGVGGVFTHHKLKWCIIIQKKNIRNKAVQDTVINLLKIGSGLSPFWFLCPV